MPTIIESPVRPKALALVNLVFDAALSDPVKPSLYRIHRRYFKLYEELGEASQAYLAVTGSNTKRLTFTDLDIELCDVFVVYVDQVLTMVRMLFAGAETSAVDELRHAMANHILSCLNKPVTLNTGDHIARLMRVLSTTHLDTSAGLATSYQSLLTGCEDLFMMLLLDPRPAEAAQPRVERLDFLLGVVERKTNKWKSIRTTND